MHAFFLNKLNRLNRLRSPRRLIDLDRPLTQALSRRERD